MNWRPWIGAAINLEMWIFLSSNILCLYCMKRGRLFTSQDNPVYIITAINIFSETLQLLIHVVYVGPSIFFGDWIFEGDQSSLGVMIVAVWFLNFWYYGSFCQIVMAANRMCVVFLPGRKILTRNRIIILMTALFIVALVAVTYSQILSPCCRITPDHRYYAYSYLGFNGSMDNPSMIYVDVPLDTSASIICGLSYCFLFSYVYRMGIGELGHRKREIRLCIQFLITFLVYTVTWSTFFIFPHLGITTPEPFMVTTVVFMANCGMNSLIYLVMNKEIKLELKKLTGRVSPAAVYHSTVRNEDSHVEQTKSQGTSGTSIFP